MKTLKKLFIKYEIDGYIVPKNDEYFNEYVNSSNDRLKFISNFSGSAGFSIILKKKNYLFVDGRYTNILNLTRFNNQGVNISNPIPTSNIVTRDGETQVTTAREAYRMAAFSNSFTKANENLTSIGKKFVNLASKIRGFFG